MWPATLPQELKLAGHSEIAPDLVIRTEMSVGPAKARRRVSDNVRLFSASLVMTVAQCALLDEFFVDSTKGGSLPFQWTHPRTGNLIDFRFIGPPTYTPRAPRHAPAAKYLATFQLEALPGTEITDEIPPIEPLSIPADQSVFVFALEPDERNEAELLLVEGAVPEADAVPGDIFIGTFVEAGVEELEQTEVVGAALYTSGGVIGPGGGNGGEPGGGFPNP